MNAELRMMNAELRMMNAEFRDATLGFAPILHSTF